MSELLQKWSQVFISGMGEDVSDILSQRRLGMIKNLEFPAVWPGVSHANNPEYPWLYNAEKLIQEPGFLYLSGLNQAGLVLVLLPISTANPQGQSILYLPNRNEGKEFWDGLRFGFGEEQALKELEQLCGIDEFRPILQLEEDLYKWGAQYGKLGFSCEDYKVEMNPEKVLHRSLQTDFSWKFRQQTCGRLRLAGLSFDDVSIQWKHLRLRMKLDENQQACMNQAQKVTKKAFENTLKSWMSLESENDVQVTLEYHLRKGSPWGLSFPTICASGANAGVLHYVKNDEALADDAMVLLDFGAKIGSMPADISRTVPVSGKYNPLQALLYDIVLDTQKYYQTLVKPGATLEELDFKAWDYLEKLLNERFLSRGGQCRRSYQPNSSGEGDAESNSGHPVRPHGISHFIGEKVHEGDSFRLNRSLPLEPGHVISNEPGLYGWFEMELEGQLFSESLGIRIEDDLLITSDGCENLSKALPKERAEIEKLIENKLG